jgi:hypothetical protein
VVVARSGCTQEFDFERAQTSTVDVVSSSPGWDTSRGVSIAEASQRTGLSRHTLRYYERAGLICVASDKPAAKPVPNPTTHPIRPFGRHVIGRKLNSHRRRAGTANQDIPPEPSNVENPRTTCAAHTRESRRRGRRDKSDYIRVLQAALRDAGYLDYDSSIDPTDTEETPLRFGHPDRTRS